MSDAPTAGVTDPHVVSLEYRLDTPAGVAFQATATPVEFDIGDFRGRLADGVLRVDAIRHFADDSDARAALQPFLRAWEIAGSLPLGSAMRFAFVSAHVVDRTPSPTGGRVHALSFHEGVNLHAQVSFQRAQYPAPPIGLEVTPLVEMLWGRYRAMLENREPLQAMGYACLTAIQTEAGGRDRIPATFAIHRDVVNKLGELTSARDAGPEAARKLRHGMRPLIPAESAWLKKAIRTIIRHLMAPEGSRTGLTMGDLPPLGP